MSTFVVMPEAYQYLSHSTYISLSDEAGNLLATIVDDGIDNTEELTTEELHFFRELEEKDLVMTIGED